jgi:hypothetical protein
MEWASVTGSVDFLGEDNQTPLWDDAPARGHLPEHVAAALARVLRRHTGTPDDCWFGLSTHAADDLPAPELAVPGQGLWLVRGPVELAAANFVREPAEQSASAWWPADRAWFVATDIDLMSTYLGGSAALVAELLADPALEVVPATARQSTAWDADPVNPLPGSARP